MSLPVFHGRKLGRLPDKRSLHERFLRLHSLYRSLAQDLPASVDLTSKMPSIYDQGQEGSCVDNATAGAAQYDEMQEGITPAIMPSRQFLYFNARVKEEGTDPSEDSGSTIADGLKAMADFGYPDEAHWPYDPSHFAQTPPDSIYQEAAAHKITDFARVPDNSANDIKSALSLGKPVILGINVYSNFPMEGNGDVPMPAGGVEGGHGILLVGYDDSAQKYKFRNSWGTSWGNQGYGTLPYDYVHNAQYASDFWVINSVPGATPNPPAPPTPPSPVVPDVTITLANKTVSVSKGWKVGAESTDYVCTNIKNKIVLYPKGWSLVNPQKCLETKFGAIDWQSLLTALEAIVKQYGPSALPVIQQWMVQAALPGWVQSLIMALGELLISSLPAAA